MNRVTPSMMGTLVIFAIVVVILVAGNTVAPRLLKLWEALS